MKYNKFVFGVLLCFCVLLACMPAMAAQVEVAGWSTDILPKGEVYGDDPSETLSPGAVNNATPDTDYRVMLAKSEYIAMTGFDESTVESYYAYAQTASANPNLLKGVYFKGTMIYDGQQIYFKDVPVIAVGRNSNATSAQLFIHKADIVANQCTADYATKLTSADTGYIADVSDPTKIGTGSFQFTGFYGMETSKETVDTKAFPAGTIFISVADLDNSAAGWADDYYLGYPVMLRPGAATTDGPSQAFTAPTSGTYKVYAMRADTTSWGERHFGVQIVSNSETVNAYFPHISGKLLPSSNTFFWDTPKESAIVTLVKGAPFEVSMPLTLNSASSNRGTAIALVPTSATEFIAQFEDTSAITEVGIENSIRMGDQLLPAETIAKLSGSLVKFNRQKNAVNAVVNGVDVSANQWDDFVAGGTDLFGDTFEGPSVYDAIKVAGLDVKADGTRGESVFIGDEQVYNTHKIPLTEGLAITVNTGDLVTIENFSPIKYTEIGYITLLKSGNLVERFLTGTLNSLGLSFVASTNGYTSLAGAHMTGYTTNTEAITVLNTDVDAAVWPFGEKTDVTIPAGSRSYMMNNSSTPQWSNNGNQTDLAITGGTFATDTEALFGLDEASGTVGFKPNYKFTTLTAQGVNVAENLDRSNLYITNKNANGSIVVKRQGDKFALTTNGFAHVMLVRVAANGSVTLEKADTLVLAPYVDTVAAGEKIYVWGYNPLNGTGWTLDAASGLNMKPLCVPIQ